MIVIVLVPAPGRVAGLKTAEAAAGKPLAERVTVPLNLFSAVAVTVYVALEPVITDCVAGVTTSE